MKDYGAEFAESLKIAQRKWQRADNDIRLTETAKRQAKAAAYVELRGTSESLKAERDAARAARRTDLQRRLYGLKPNHSASDVLSLRDATDRVARLESGDQKGAIELLHRAAISGDTVLTRAILATAFDREWDQVLTAYQKAQPADDAAVEELWSMQTADVTSELGDAVGYTPRPPGMAELNDWQMRTLAAAHEPIDPDNTAASNSIHRSRVAAGLERADVIPNNATIA